MNRIGINNRALWYWMCLCSERAKCYCMSLSKGKSCFESRLWVYTNDALTASRVKTCIVNNEETKHSKASSPWIVWSETFCTAPCALATLPLHIHTNRIGLHYNPRIDSIFECRQLSDSASNTTFVPCFPSACNKVLWDNHRSFVCGRIGLSHEGTWYYHPKIFWLQLR